MDNPEKLAIEGTQEEEKNATQYVLDTNYTHSNINNVIKT